MSVDAMKISATNGLKKNMPVLEDITTAIDALCIGFVYLELSIENAPIVFSIIGITTFVLSFFQCSFSKTNHQILRKTGRAYCGDRFPCHWIKNLA